MMRITFAVARSFNPKQTYREYPLGVGFLGTILRQAGHEVCIFDQNVEGLEDRALFDHIDRFRPQVVGFSVITPNYPVARGQIRRLRREYPEVRILAGGVHANLFPEDLVEDGVDVVVLGEAEPVIAPLIDCLESGRPLEGIAGLVVRRSQGGVFRTPGTPALAALDELPIIDRRLYNLTRYTHHSMLASRGCPYHCAFCCNYTGTVRGNGAAARWHERILDEIEHLRDCFEAREIFFADDIFLLRKPDILQFCKAAAHRRLGVNWIGQMRADKVDSEVASALASAGCQRIYFGIESGSDTILRDARKGMTTDQLRRGVNAAIEAGLRVKTGWIYGLPGTLEDQYASIPFMLDLRPHEISIHQLIPFPGTVFYEQPARFGIRIASPKSFESFCYGGLDGNIQFDYLSQRQLVTLLEDTAQALESAGYVSSDQAGPESEFIYTTPLHRNSMNVFRQPVAAPLVS